MRFSPTLLDEIRQRLPVSQVVSRRVKLKRQGREYAGLSPFKHEKTPSFTVNDRKGFYHCFSSGEHGDIFKFVMKTEGLSFTEAVERLAREAGVPLPRPEPRQAEREAEFDRLRRVAEVSCVFFQEQLDGAAGREARDYLARRGVGQAEIETFRLGYAPAGRDRLKRHLAQLGFTAEEAARSGMLIAGDDIAQPYDRFRNRLIFPIANLSGAVIAFGGRALAPDQQPKYLNSPETPLFHKGGVLFNAARARQAAYERGQLIVAEGYMDVIALARAGFPNAVAPLGTALTEDQLRLMWRMASEPVMCFDGDAAGRKAAFRALETALPHLKPESSLRFAFLPDGLDPDDMLRDRGAEALAAVIGGARPLIDALWAMESGADDWATPERQALLLSRLRARAAAISDREVSRRYHNELTSRYYDMLRERRPAPAKGARRAGGERKTAASGSVSEGRASESLRNSALVGHAAIAPREALILLALLNHPWLLEEEAENAAGLIFESAGLGALRDAIIDVYAQQSALDKEHLHDQLTKRGLAHALTRVGQAITHFSDRNARPDASREDVLSGWRDMMALHRRTELERELKAAEEDYCQNQTEAAYERIREIVAQLANNAHSAKEAARNGDRD